MLKKKYCQRKLYNIEFLFKIKAKLVLKCSVISSFFMYFLFLLAGIAFSDPPKKRKIPNKPEGKYVHFQSFKDSDWDNYYIPSSFPHYTGEWAVERSNFVPYEKVLVTKTANANYAISTRFDTPLKLNNQPLIIQYEVRFQESLTCGGAAMKVYGANFNPDVVNPRTPYIIKFGPDRCGTTDKVVFNFCHKNSKTGQVVEHVLKDCPKVPNDRLTHLYTLIIRPDNTYEILVDASSVKQGSLFNGFQPEVNPPKEIDDPNDKKPADWVDNEMYPDPSAKKPDDWDETQPEYIPNPNKLNPPNGWLLNEPPRIPDPKVPKPAEWDDEFFGQWEAPLIDNPKCVEARGCGKYYPPAIRNPKYKGKWNAPQIKNPAYKGPWAPRKIPNPDYYEEPNVHNLDVINGIGFEFSSSSKGECFNNILVSTDEALVHNWNRQRFFPMRRLQNIELKRLEPRPGMPEFGEPLPQQAHQTKQRSVLKQNVEQQSYQQTVQNPDGDLTATINNAANSFVNGYINLYKENPALAIAVVATVIFVPLSLCCCLPLLAPSNKPSHHSRRAEKGDKSGHRGKRRKVVYEYSDEEGEEQQKPKTE